MTHSQFVYIVVLGLDKSTEYQIGPVYVERSAAERAVAEFEKATSCTRAYALEREIEFEQPAVKAHECVKFDYCICSLDRTDERCPRHGNGRPRCACGRYV